MRQICLWTGKIQTSLYHVNLMTTMTEPSVRERIMETAQRLFYRDGFRAVGIDTIIAEAGVAKMSLYRHFPSKDDLIVAHLEESNRQYWEWLDGAVADIDDPLDKLVGMFAAIEKLTTSPECLGCTFQGTAAEFPDHDYPGHQVALAHKRTVRDRFAQLAAEAGLRRPEELADQLLLLMDGAWVAARMYGPDNPAAGLTDAARTLIEAHR
jgi:AcrR family transcriptional regulator